MKECNLIFYSYFNLHVDSNICQLRINATSSLKAYFNGGLNMSPWPKKIIKYLKSPIK